MPVFTFNPTNAYAQLLKDGSGLTWAQLLSAVPQVKTGWGLIKVNSVFGGSITRTFWPFDVSSLPVDPTEGTITADIASNGTVDRFKVYYQDFGASVDNGDWASEGGLTAASATIDLLGETSASIALINLSNVRSANGRFVMIVDDEITEPGLISEADLMFTNVVLTVTAPWFSATGTVSLPSLSALGAGRDYQRVYGTGTAVLPSLSTPLGRTDTFANIPLNLSRVKGGRASIQSITDGTVKINES
jgi:hypothetical protein